MVEEDLAKMDFSKSQPVVKECAKLLAGDGINYFLIYEVTSSDGLYSKYAYNQQWKQCESAGVGEVAKGVDQELIANHLGGLTAVVFDIFAGQFRSNFNRQPTFEELTDIMLHFHKIYLNNVQPK